MSDRAFDLSVIIPSHNRREMLLTVLRAFEQQTIGPERFEVIISLDASTDGSAEAVLEINWPFAVRTTVPRTRGASSARNAGASLARAPRLVFLDDDIVVAPGFLAAHLRAASDNPGAVVMGESTPAIDKTDWFSLGMKRWWQDHFQKVRDPGHRFSHLDVMSGNMSLDKALFDRVGGFDLSLKIPREDYELGYRLSLAGAPITFEPLACGLHYERSDMARSFARARQEGTADVQIARKHPALFRNLTVANLTSPSLSGRVLRFALFRTRGFARFCALVLQSTLPGLERLGLRGWWQQVYNTVWRVNYYGTAAAALELGSELTDLSDRHAATRVEPDRLSVDLIDGLDTIRRQISERRPKHLSLMLGDWQVTELRDAPGAERLEARHLDGALRATLYGWAGFVSALELLPELPATVPEGMVCITPRGEAGCSLGTIDLADWSLTPRNEALTYPMRLLVRRGALPLGWTHLGAPPKEGRFWHVLRQKIVTDRRIVDRLIRSEMLPAPVVPLPSISVVICTRDRTDNLRRCLAAIQALDYPDFEVIVVDNAPATDTTHTLVQSLPGIRHVFEDRPGLDWARNRGIEEARHSIIAYADDDTQADSQWLRGLAAAFAEPGVDAVTGLVVPMKLDTPARVYFEDVYGGMGRGFVPWFREVGNVTMRDMLWPSGCGVGANMAFRRAVFDKVGWFDPALDVGTSTRGGGDIEMFHRVMAKGAGLAYAPEAIIWHEHRADFPALLRQLRDNGSGFAAYLMAAWRNRTLPRHTILAFALKDWIWGWQIKRLLRPRRHRRDTVLAEIGGILASRRLYLKARAEAEVLAATAAPAAERARAA